MDSTKKNARVAGALYFLLFLPAPLSLIYIPNTLIVRGDAAATAPKILAHQTLFRVGMISELFTAIAWIFIAFALYRLLKGVNQTLAILMVVLGSIICAPLTFVNVVNEMAALKLLHAPQYLAAFSQQQIQAAALFFLGLHSDGFIVQEVLWGAWLIPFGLLVMRSRFLPRPLGALLIVNAFAYIAASLTLLLASPAASFVNRWAFIPETGEIWIVLWLMIKGANVQASPLPAPEAA